MTIILDAGGGSSFQPAATGPHRCGGGPVFSLGIRGLGVQGLGLGIRAIMHCRDFKEPPTVHMRYVIRIYYGSDTAPAKECFQAAKVWKSWFQGVRVED